MPASADGPLGVLGKGGVGDLVGNLTNGLTKSTLPCLVDAIQKLVGDDDYNEHIKPIIDQITDVLNGSG